MKTIQPCLWFDGQAEEAAAFYCSIFDDAEVLDRMYYGPDTPGTEGDVMTVTFRIGATTYTALNGGPQFPFTEAVSLEVHCETDDEVHRYYDALVRGGATQPCGWLKDRYGLSWQVVPAHLLEWMNGPDTDAGARVMQAVLSTHGKLDPAVLRKAYEG